MITVKIEIPLLHCTEQYDESGNSEPYVWFAYFWVDAASTFPEPISVFVPFASDTRALFPDDIGNNQDIPIPPALGRFQVNLDDSTGSLLLGVLAVVLEEDETPEDAIAAGYDAFRDAVKRELNKFVIMNGATIPTPAQIKQLQDAITASVKQATKSKLSIWSELFDNQDDILGVGYALFLGPQLTDPGVFPLGLPPIDEDAYTVSIEWTQPPSGRLVKVGHQRYEFVRPLLVVQKTIADPCPDQAKAVRAAAARLQALQNQLRQLKGQLARATVSEKPAIRADIEDLRKNQIPAATKNLSDAQRALQLCRLRNGWGLETAGRAG